MKGTTKTPETLYYYCNLETFFSIIQNRSLWLTDVSKSNDSMEQKYLGVQFVKHYEKYMRKLLNIDEKQLLEKNNIAKTLSEFYPTPAWVMCMSEKRDDLSQWRGYGDDAKGICIAFDFEYLNHINSIDEGKCEEAGGDYMCFRKVIYGNKLLDDFIEDLIKKEMPSNEKSKALSKFIIDSYYKPYSKPEYFSDEAEWRIIYSNTKRNFTYNFNALNEYSKEFNSCFSIKRKEFEVRNGYLQAHIELGIENLIYHDCRKYPFPIIKEIIIGPKSKVAIEDIEHMLSYFGYINDKKPYERIVSHSEAISYR